MSTITVYPDANPETTTCDGWVSRLGVNEDFATIRAGVGSGGTDDAGADAFLFLRGSSTTNQFDQLRRLIFLFDTSAIGPGMAISAATLSLWGIGKAAGLGETALAIVSANPNANTGLVDADYNTLGSTTFGSVTYPNFIHTNSGYTDISLNAAGLAAIAPQGITKLGARLEWDRAGTFSGVWVAGDPTYFQVDLAENASGQTRAPKLTVTYSARYVVVTR